MGPIDWLILVLWAVTGVEIGLEVRRRRWAGAAISAVVFVLLTWVGWGIFVYLGRTIASWF